MNIRQAANFLALAIALTCSCAVGKEKPHKWRGISYPDLPNQFGDGFASPSIGPSNDNGFNLTSLPMSIRLHEDGMRRSDTFKFNRNPGNTDSRDWGSISIEVGAEKWTTTMPSSLFRYVHGVAAPHHKSTLR